MSIRIKVAPNDFNAFTSLLDYDNFTNSKKIDWFDTGPWHNKNICSKLYGTTFEGFITQAITDRYNIMCSLVAHDRM